MRISTLGYLHGVFIYMYMQSLNQNHKWVTNFTDLFRIGYCFCSISLLLQYC